MGITLEDVKSNLEIVTYFEQGDKFLGAQHINRHCIDHAMLVSKKAGMILRQLGYSQREAELAEIAGYVHDIGNVINRRMHDVAGAMLAYNILSKMGMEPFELAEVMAGIGNHDERYGVAVSNISAAVILADKSDVRRTRVRERDISSFDIHDRVNYAVEKSFLCIKEDKDTNLKQIILELTVDDTITTIGEYFEIFLERMLMCRRAAKMLGATFELTMNETKII